MIGIMAELEERGQEGRKTVSGLENDIVNHTCIAQYR
jgi:hypothetical protein